MRQIVDRFQNGVATLAVLLALGCSKNEPAPTAPAQTELTENVARSFEETLPQIDDTHGYTGSKACQDCHKDQYTSWHRTYHRTMTQVASPESVQADFNNVILTNDNTRFTLYKNAEEHWVRMEQIAVADDVRAEPLNLRIGLITGSHHMQVFWVPEGTGNLQIGFPFTWLIPEKRWVPRNSTFIRPAGLEHRPEAWNIVCSRCHTTGVEPRFEAGTRSVATHVGELGISCEACHGPGRRHHDLRVLARSNGQDTPLELQEIVHPEKISPERASQVCGFCHSMKWIDKSENWREKGFQYRPGDNLEDTTPIIRAAATNRPAELEEYLARNPNLLTDFFWSDGMIRVSGREYNGLIESPCYKGGKFSCLSCHSGHESEPDDLLAQKAKSNKACLDCHEKFREPQQLTAHSRHSAGSSGSECYNCHMPHTTYGVLKAIRSHEVSSPRVADDLATGRPNACNLCHLDKSLAWSADYLKEWYQQEKPALSENATNVSHAVWLALAGDAGQRALIGWHLGWKPALEVSGRDWIAPVLGQLLDDPYSAVRIVAERSLKSISKQTPGWYDYTIPPESRRSAREEVWKTWKASLKEGGIEKKRADAVLARPEDLEAQRTAYEQVLGWRNHRPVRLRE